MKIPKSRTKSFRAHEKAVSRRHLLFAPHWKIIFLLSPLLFGCHPSPEEVKAARFQMGTTVEIIALGKDREELHSAVEAAFAEVQRVERLMSPFREGSDVKRINRSSGGALVAVSPEVFELIEKSLQISNSSQGAFDITVAGLQGLWSFDPDRPRIASPEEIASRLPLVGYQGVILGKENPEVGLAREGMRVDLSGIAKGYAVDRAMEGLTNRGVAMAMVNAGGDLRVTGTRNQRPWHVGIQDPRDPKSIIAWIEAADLSVATSGDYEKYIEKDGKRYCHIIDPKSGVPAGSCQSVTVIAGETWLADALATAVFVLGPQKGLALVEGMEGVEAIIIDSRGQRLVSKGIGERVHWLR